MFYFSQMQIIYWKNALKLMESGTLRLKECV